MTNQKKIQELIQEKEYKEPKELRQILTYYKLTNKLNNIYFDLENNSPYPVKLVSDNSDNLGQIITGKNENLTIDDKIKITFYVIRLLNLYKPLNHVLIVYKKENLATWKINLDSLLTGKTKETYQNKPQYQLLQEVKNKDIEIGDLVMETKNENPGIKKTQENDTLKFVLIGGGSRSKLYEDTIFATHKAFKQESASIPKYDVKKFTNPNKNSLQKGLVMGDIPEQYFDRYLVAYGLSIPGKSNISKSSKKYLEGYSLDSKSSNKNDIPKQDWWERANIGIGKLS